MSGEGGGGGRGNRAGMTRIKQCQITSPCKCLDSCLFTITLYCSAFKEGQRARVQGVTKGRGKKMRYLRTLAIFSLLYIYIYIYIYIYMFYTCMRAHTLFSMWFMWGALQLSRCCHSATPSGTRSICNGHTISSLNSARHLLHIHDTYIHVVYFCKSWKFSVIMLPHAHLLTCASAGTVMILMVKFFFHLSFSSPMACSAFGPCTSSFAFSRALVLVSSPLGAARCRTFRLF
jgi:hypothetical protein